ncbi:DEAD/DEAH box helicase family protein [Actinoplanes subglobosus]|uniref:DEAD/DEAH box helicase family protein n=1 Tax=Actinoplanes subglobosus TaxID=1547892 RepID=A0ABV8IRZ6_9ACTN
MRLQFTVQEFQSEAVAAVADCFAGQPYSPPGPDNALLVSGCLLENVRAVQRRAGLPLSTRLATSEAAPDAPNLDVEMETGTGKTYVYIRTIMELHRRYGWSRFIVVVPGVAIREGVRKAFDTTAEHFQQLYGTRARPFTYDSSELHELERFRSGAGVQVMIINLQAFNSASRENRRIYEEQDGFGSRRPIDVVRASRPIVIIDEPQRIGSARSQESLSRFDPLMVLRYSATHRVRHDLVHRLDALEAYRRKLVKRIAVVGIEGEPGPAKRRIQIREVIRTHLEKERGLHARGVKVLSLLFIDQVIKYRDYSRPDQLGDYARIFVEEYRELTAGEPDGPYRRYLDGIPVERTHQGYFAIDRRTGRMIDGNASDADAYDLILRDRERLLSLGEPVRFVFSHSALREGWDNPNVFVMGMLKCSDNTVSRRQEIGRGLRLAVDQRGERIDGPANELTVVADESYASFVAGLQAEGDPRTVVDGRRGRRTVDFARPEFREVVALLRRKAFYRVRFDSSELVRRCVAALASGLVARHFTVQTASATQTYPKNPDKAQDLIGLIADRVRLTRRTVGTILATLSPPAFALCRSDPQAAAEIIHREKATLITERVRYQILPGTREIVTGPFPSKDRRVRIPDDFTIPTPLGDYHPGWLIVRAGRIIVTAEGGDDDPARIECARRWFEALGDDRVTFSVAAPPSASRSAGDRTPRPRAGRRRSATPR